MEAGLVCGEPRAHPCHPAECPDGDVPVSLTAPRASPMFKPQQLFRCFLDKSLHGILIAKPIAAGDRVVSMLVQAVAGLDDAGGAALSRDGVTSHRINLRNHSHAELRICLTDSNRCPQARSPAADD